LASILRISGRDQGAAEQERQREHVAGANVATCPARIRAIRVTPHVAYECPTNTFLLRMLEATTITLRSFPWETLERSRFIDWRDG
jgi:hypothetical protein